MSRASANVIASSSLIAIQQALAMVMPLIMIGAIGLMIMDFPVPELHAALDRVFGLHWRGACTNLVAGTFGVASLAVLCMVSGNIATRGGARRRKPNPLAAIAVALSCFFVVAAPAATGAWVKSFSLIHGLFVALFVAIAATRLYGALADLPVLRLPIRTLGNDLAVREAVSAMPAGILTILAFAVLRFGLEAVGVSGVQTAVSHAFAAPFAGMENDLGLAFAYTSLCQVLWLLGIHGPNLLFSLEDGVFVPALLANMHATLWHQFPPEIFTKTFFDCFTRIGGSGSTLCLIVAVLVAGRDGGTRRLCLFALIPAFCNVNEPLMFGIPLVLNPTYAVPFLVVPLVQTLTAYGATVAGWMPHTAIPLIWTTPALFSGYVATGDVSGVVMQAFNLALGIAIYLPFVRWSDRMRADQGQRAMTRLLHVAEATAPAQPERKCLGAAGPEGDLAETLAYDLGYALRRGTGLYLEYQPQIDTDTGRVVGVEALLRWLHPSFGRVPPPITVALAEDLDDVDRLGQFVLEETCARRAAWRGTADDTLVACINVTPRQLLEARFADDVIACIARHDLQPRQIELEITESTVLSPHTAALGAVQRLRAHGVRVAIDDFGMGHTSLRYLREFPVDTIKIDRSFTLAGSDDVNDHIVRSIVDLSRSLGITTVVEGVETSEQLDRFRALGCTVVQGYLFCRPITADACLAFIRRHAEATA
jgi:cellobiose PTS system EIIC component